MIRALWHYLNARRRMHGRCPPHRYIQDGHEHAFCLDCGQPSSGTLQPFNSLSLSTEQTQELRNHLSWRKEKIQSMNQAVDARRWSNTQLPPAWPGHLDVPAKRSEHPLFGNQLAFFVGTMGAAARAIRHRPPPG